jgi:hypothetical protein
MARNLFFACNRHNPCPCCGNTKYRCKSRITTFDLPGGEEKIDMQYFCMSYRGDLPGYKYCGETHNLLWGKYITQELSAELSAIWSESNHQSSNNHQRQKVIAKSPVHLRRTKILKNTASHREASPLGHMPAGDRWSKLILVRQIEQVNYQNLLSIEERDIEISKLLQQLKLKAKHKQALYQRGFSDRHQVYYQFKSLDYKQKLTNKVSPCLAGISPDGLSLVNKYSGLLIPIRNERQQYLGWQTRLDFDANLRYLWAKSAEFSVHLKEHEEIPLGFYLPIDKIKSRYIGIVEGVGFKAIHTANKFKQVVIGASGGMFASSPQQLKVYLDRASLLTNSNRVLFYADAGAVLNRLVLIQYQKAATLIISYGYELKVAWWGQITKSQGDIDEYDRGFEIISLEEFFAIAKKFVKPSKNKYINHATNN